MNSYLFVFTISPVQSFIAQARKTKDLFTGSQLISDLIRNAMNHFNDNEIIFPFKSNKHLPNRFLALINKENDEEVQKLGEIVENSVRNYFKEKANEIFIKYLKLDLISNKIFIKQIESFLEIYWTAINLNSDYYEDYENVEKQLSSIKNYRPFIQLEERGRKCSICGQRNVIIKNDDNKISDQIKGLINPGEGLCAICFTKRFYIDKSYPSTAEIALSDTINKIENNDEGKNILNKFQQCFGSLFDAQLYYEENLNKKYFEKQGFSSLIKSIDEIIKCHRELKKYATSKNLTFPSYYSLVMFDADSMGDIVAGKKLKENYKHELKEFQKTLAKSLNDFINQTKLHESAGSIVYSGGDDFMAFMNLNYLFTELKTLHKNFDNIINSQVNNFLKDKITFSAGIVIAHYKTPLNVVIDECRKLEKDAKNISSEKNAFAISVMKHSGEIIKTIYNWHRDNIFVLDHFNLLSKILNSNEISNSFIKNFQIEFSEAIHKKEKVHDKMILTELERLIKNSKAAKEKKDEIIQKVIDNVFGLYYSSTSLKNFVSALNIIDFIAKYLNGGSNENKN
ncbi:type III-B CRISPR-associated protein Cas10/Cmr2 [Rosettibacter firmus]|uniref:type III-B CRISPR-associated protein Cas10/Cmr2 n=1 Tax=Rosettibacter firmus TaxID=3111522 RepID=UPI00336BCAF1